MNREIKFRVWDIAGRVMVPGVGVHPSITEVHDGYTQGEDGWLTISPIMTNYVLMQFTGLKDRNGAGACIFEGDFIDWNGNIKGNIYESPQIYEEGIDFVVEGMGTSAWRNSESVAMGRGCRYAK
jgi:hypothetical protein